MNCLELFAGAGGMALGAGLAGVQSAGLVEIDQWACDTLRENKQRNFPLSSSWKVSQSDVREFDFSSLGSEVDLVIGGPPCQPFSLAGKHAGNQDQRDMFPAAVDAVRILRPQAFVFENVRGLTRPAFANYFEYIKLRLAFPDLRRRANEGWFDHLRRLQREFSAGRKRGLTYQVLAHVVDAADFGVPQRRHRVFIIGFRSDVGSRWAFPKKTHSFDELLRSQWVTGDYWEIHKIAIKDRPEYPERLKRRIEKLRVLNFPSDQNTKRWLTVRDAISDLPDPFRDGMLGKETINGHIFQDGARPYPGHTGSPPDFPSKALKAGDHGVPGGENMLAMIPNGYRYFTVREAARLQTFPDGYRFHGSWTETMRQLGNAVPVKLAESVLSSVVEHVSMAEERKLGALIKKLGQGQSDESVQSPRP